MKKRPAPTARVARSEWVAGVVADGRAAIRAARGAAGAAAGKKRGFDGPAQGPGRVAGRVAGPGLVTISAARDTASALAHVAATDALVARSRLLYSLAAPYGPPRADPDAKRALEEAARDAAYAFELSAAVERGAADAVRPSSALAAAALEASRAKEAEAAAKSEAFGTSGDYEKRRRLVREIVKLRLGKAADDAEHSASSRAPVYSMVDDFGLEQAVGRLEGIATRKRLAGTAGLEEAAAAATQAGGSLHAQTPFIVDAADQLQWVFPY
jgi:hypothetical protein